MNDKKVDPGAFEPEVADVIVFRLRRELGRELIMEISNKIAEAAKTITDGGVEGYYAVLLYPLGSGFNNHYINDGIRKVRLPLDDDIVEEIALINGEIESWRFKRGYNIWDALTPKRRKSVMMAPVPKPIPQYHPVFKTYDLNEILPNRRYLLDEPAQSEGKSFHDLLEGYPFKEKTARENRRWIEIEVIARLRALFPLIYEADQEFFEGGLVKALKRVSNEQYQSRLSDEDLSCLRRAYWGTNPCSIGPCLSHVCSRIVLQDMIAAKKLKSAHRVSSTIAMHDDEVVDLVYASGGVY